MEMARRLAEPSIDQHRKHDAHAIRGPPETGAAQSKPSALPSTTHFWLPTRRVLVRGNVGASCPRAILTRDRFGAEGVPGQVLVAGGSDRQVVFDPYAAEFAQ